MKLLFRMFILLLSCIFCRVSANMFHLKTSTIEEVRILGNTAEIERKFVATSVSPGYSTLVLHHLPYSVDDQSIRVKGKGNAPILLLSTLVRESVMSRNEDETFLRYLKDLANTRQAVLDQYHAYSSEYSQLDRRRQTVESYVASYLQQKEPSGVDSRISPDKLLEILNFQDSELKASSKVLLSLKALISELEDALSELKDAIAILRTSGIYKPLHCQDIFPHNADKLGTAACPLLPPDEARYWPESRKEKDILLKIHTPVDSPASALSTAVFAVTHMVNTANWQAEYDLYLDSNMESTHNDHNDHSYSLRIDFMASVAQNTGEDWLNTKLQLLTSYPTRLIEAPHPPRTSVSYNPPATVMYTGLNKMARSRESAPHVMKKRATPMVMEMASADSVMTARDMDMEVMDAEVHRSGDLGATATFTLPHKHSIYSGREKLKNQGVANDAKGQSSGSDRSILEFVAENERLLVSSLQIPSVVFSYAVPTSPDRRAFLRAWGKYLPIDTPSSSVPPLLGSSDVRVFIQGQYSGKTGIPATQPGQMLRMSLGEDRNLKIAVTRVLPTHKTKEEEGSGGWFISEKKKYHVKFEDLAVTVSSSYDRPHLMVFSEYLPHSSEDDIRVDLMSPDLEKVITLDKDIEDPDEVIASVLAHSAVKASLTADGMIAFMSAKTHNVVWAKWLRPQERVTFNYKYRLLWPEAKEIYIN